MIPSTPDPTGSGEATREPYIFWQDDWVTLWCGRMEDVLPLLGQFDACITDPPYGETSLSWDRWPVGWPALVAKHTRSLWSFGSFRMFLKHRDDISPLYLRDEHGRFRAARPDEWRLAQDVVWEKPGGSGFAADRFRRVHEHVVHFYTGSWADAHHEAVRVAHHGPDKSRSRETGRTAHTTGGAIGADRYVDDGYRIVRTVIRAGHAPNRLHPTEKPVKVLAPLIEYSVPPGGSVLDVFGGSCSLAMAIRELNAKAADPLLRRKAVLIEADEAMCAKAVEKRLSVTDLFTGSAL